MDEEKSTITIGGKEGTGVQIDGKTVLSGKPVTTDTRTAQLLVGSGRAEFSEKPKATAKK